MKKILTIIFGLVLQTVLSQTTDLAVTVEARNAANVAVSQVTIFEDYYYLVTITNSGNAVTNATFNQTFSNTLIVTAYQSQNPMGGASSATNLNFASGTLTGTLPNMPAASSVQIRIDVTAPSNPMGVSTMITVTPPNGVTDTNPTSNSSNIATNVIQPSDLGLTITHTQTNPSGGAGLAAWGNTATYTFTITNTSSIAIPISGFSSHLFLNTPLTNGAYNAQLMSISCVGGTSGMSCVSLDSPSGTIFFVDGGSINNSDTTYISNNEIIFTPGGSLTFQLVYKYTEGECAPSIFTEVEAGSFIRAYSTNNSLNQITSNNVITPLLEDTFCPCIDVTNETTVTNGISGNAIQSWNDQVTFQTVVTNLGPDPANIITQVQNLSAPLIPWSIVSASCVSTTGTANCNITAISISQNGQQWTSNTYTLDPGSSITFETVVLYYEPSCTPTPNNQSNIKSTSTHTAYECFAPDNTDDDSFYFPPTNACAVSDLYVTKTQTNPVLPIGSDPNNTMPWDPVTYEITVTNPSDSDVYFALLEYYDFINPSTVPTYTGMLQSVNCIGTTGTAQCQPITNANIGVTADSVGDIFFTIEESDNWLLPANSSITIEMVIEWSFDCSFETPVVATKTLMEVLEPGIDQNSTNNTAKTLTYFATCVDLIIQTYPAYPTLPVDTTFFWVVDISNAGNSSMAIDAFTEILLDNALTITGAPICNVTSGNAMCPTNIVVNGNSVSAIIPEMDTGSSIQIRIPVNAPDYGGSFNTYAEVQPNIANNGEIIPETNTSSSNIQILAPAVTKSFDPQTIQFGQATLLTFTLYNITGNPEQTGISFTDNLAAGLTLISEPEWVNSNGATANFIGQYGDSFVGLENLHFPEGIESCTFSVLVTAANPGIYVNNSDNLSNVFNLDYENFYTELEVIENPNPNLDLSITKTVDDESPKVGDLVTFTITLQNNSNVFATDIEITEILPAGYQLSNYNVSMGTYDGSIWYIPIFFAEESATLTITATVTTVEDYLNTATISYLNETDTNTANNSSQAYVTPDCFSIYNAISPNNDGKNDYFTIDCIEYYSGSNVKIYNRLGALIYEKDNYDNTFNGIPNKGILKNEQKVLPVGTYYYILTIPQTNRVYTGWLYLNY